MQIGIGYDVHRLVTGRQLILGGAVIPFEKGLLGIRTQMSWYMRFVMPCWDRLDWVISVSIFRTPTPNIKISPV